MEATHVVTGAMKNTAIDKLYEETGLETLEKRREHQKLILMYKICNRLTPNCLYNILPTVHDQTTYDMRSI